MLGGCSPTVPAASVASSAAVDVIITSAAGERPAFEPAETTVDASGPVAMTFLNRSSLAHNLVFTAGLTGATRTIVEPGASDELLLVPPGPGTYPFVCTIHDGMAGTLVVRASAARPTRGRVPALVGAGLVG
jgi:plastocyanin